MSQTWFQRIRIGFWMALSWIVVGLAGCSATGSSFDATSLDLLTPGQATLAQASAVLKAEPTNVYRQADGAFMARWSHHASLVPDAVYFTRELWLSFDAHGHFQHVVKSINVPQASHAPSVSTVTP